MKPSFRPSASEAPSSQSVRPDVYPARSAASFARTSAGSSKSGEPARTTAHVGPPCSSVRRGSGNEGAGVVDVEVGAALEVEVDEGLDVVVDEGLDVVVEVSAVVPADSDPSPSPQAAMDSASTTAVTRHRPDPAFFAIGSVCSKWDTTASVPA
ncbi:MAG: hypothetical protein ACSLFP_14335 [Acidimicrobiales bacterium]